MTSEGVRICKKVVDQADPGRGRHYIWDSELKGFGIQVEASGTRTYIVRYRPKGLGRDGKRRFVKIGRHGVMTAEQARAQAKVLLGSVAAGEDPALRRSNTRAEHVQHEMAVTFAVLCETFLRDHVVPKRKAGTATNYTVLMRKHAIPVLGNLKAGAVTRADVSKLHIDMKATPHTANRVVAVIGSMYSFAAKQDILARGTNPARDVEKYREQGRERYLSSAEMGRLGKALVQAETVGIPWDINEGTLTAKHVPKSNQRARIDPYAAAAIRLLIFTGARLREILNLKWQNVDVERGLLLLPDSKTGRKTIVLSTAALKIVQDLVTLATDQSPTGNAYVIRGDQADRPRADLKRPWSAVRKHAGLQEVRLHDLRHTYASLGAGAGLGLPIIGKLLGHSSPQTTARYAHLDADPLRRASDLIGAQILESLDGS